MASDFHIYPFTLHVLFFNPTVCPRFPPPFILHIFFLLFPLVSFFIFRIIITIQNHQLLSSFLLPPIPPIPLPYHRALYGRGKPSIAACGDDGWADGTCWGGA
ncbi:hypothetical protein CC80DRAFT_495532 [Byssothecium circinans]|uniref:Uncharacterized protein n=1 Tax=Byssothecium circinans TaxID=147558 RepID=A0A6A5TH64_9PLEO|nr:hypothetical protein CC80DRAFT_495532 [Byssothecium circinans]